MLHVSNVSPSNGWCCNSTHKQTNIYLTFDVKGQIHILSCFSLHLQLVTNCFEDHREHENRISRMFQQIPWRYNVKSFFLVLGNFPPQSGIEQNDSTEKFVKSEVPKIGFVVTFFEWIGHPGNPPKWNNFSILLGRRKRSRKILLFFLSRRKSGKIVLSKFARAMYLR